MTTIAPPLLAEWNAKLVTRTGMKLDVRPASAGDEALLVEFFRKLSPDDLRFRFLSTIRTVRPALVRPLADVDHDRTEDLLAFNEEDESLVATAMIAAEPDLKSAEVAIAVRSDVKGQGIGWSLLRHACDYAAARGIGRIESIESSQNRAALALETEMGFKARPYGDDSTLTLVTMDLTPSRRS